jgi:hypothetical protein
MEPETLRVLSHMMALPRPQRMSAKAVVVCHSEPGASPDHRPQSAKPLSDLQARL